MTSIPNNPNNPSPSYEPTDPAVGYKKPPKHSQFQKGKSGNPRGRPKAPPYSLDIKSILDGVQQGKNGKVIPTREALAVRIVSDALAGNQKAFKRFLDLLEQSGINKVAPQKAANHVVTVKSRPMTEAEKAFWRPDTHARKPEA